MSHLKNTSRILNLTTQIDQMSSDGHKNSYFSVRQSDPFTSECWTCQLKQATVWHDTARYSKSQAAIHVPQLPCPLYKIFITLCHSLFSCQKWNSWGTFKSSGCNRCPYRHVNASTINLSVVGRKALALLSILLKMIRKKLPGNTFRPPRLSFTHSCENEITYVRKKLFFLIKI